MTIASVSECGESSRLHFDIVNMKSRFVNPLLPDEMRRLKQLEDENSKFKKVVADLRLDKTML